MMTVLDLLDEPTPGGRPSEVADVTVFRVVVVKQRPRRLKFEADPDFDSVASRTYEAS